MELPKGYRVRIFYFDGALDGAVSDLLNRIQKDFPTVYDNCRMNVLSGKFGYSNLMSTLTERIKDWQEAIKQNDAAPNFVILTNSLDIVGCPGIHWDLNTPTNESGSNIYFLTNDFKWVHASEVSDRWLRQGNAIEKMYKGNCFDNVFQETDSNPLNIANLKVD